MAFFLHRIEHKGIEHKGAIMISSRVIASPSQSRLETDGSSIEGQAREVHQDRQGPLDGELLDLYVALLVVVPFVWVLRSLWS